MTQTVPQQRAEPVSVPPTPPVKERDPFFDNVKFMTIILVVVGHVWAQLHGSEVEHSAYMVVYAFHMPLFVFIAGYFSRGYTRSAGKLRGLVPSVIAPYVIFTLLSRSELYFVGGQHFAADQWLQPHYVTWFLAALVCWRLSAPIWQYLRYPVATAVAVALVVGGWGLAKELYVAHTIVLLPFFVLGLTINRERVDGLRRRFRWWMGMSVLLGMFATFYLWTSTAVDRRVTPFLYWSIDYEQMKLSLPLGMVGRLGAMALALALGAAFMAMAPRRRTWFTDMGTRTMYVFLLHGLVVKAFDYTGLIDASAVQSRPGVVLSTLAAVALGIVLSTELVRRCTRWAVEPRIDWLLALSSAPSVPTEPAPAPPVTGPAIVNPSAAPVSPR